MPKLVKRSVRGVRWRLLPEWDPVLLGPEGLPLERWRAEGRLHAVKEAAHRAVYRVESGGRAFFVKHYRCPRLADLAANLFRRCPAEREFANLTEAARRGIATLRPVAWGVRVRAGLAGDSFLVTEALAHACTLREYFERVLPQSPAGHLPGARRRLIDLAARFTAAIHGAGILHRDFHAGNILVAPASGPLGRDPGEGPPQFHLIDLLGARFTGPLPPRASLRNLAVLASAWREETSRTERWRFWRTYCAERPDLAIDPARAADEVDRLAVAHSLRIHRRRDRRSLGTNRDFTSVKTGRGEAHGVAGTDPEDLVCWLLAPDECLWRNLHRPVKLGHTSVVVEAEAGACRVALKRCRARSWWKAVTGLFRPSRARRGWCMGHALRQRGIATPRPVALCEPSRPRLLRQTYLATEWIEGAENLHLWGWRIAATAPRERSRLAARCAESVGRLVGRLHAFGAVHRDLKMSNVLVARRGERVEAWLIDVDGVRIGRPGRRRQEADLARLAVGLTAHPWVGRTLVLRFLRAYVRQFPRAQPVWKDLWRSVQGRSARAISKKGRRQEQVL